MNFSILTNSSDFVFNYFFSNAERYKEEGYHKLFLVNYKSSVQEVKNNNYLVNVSFDVGIPPIYFVGVVIFLLNQIFFHSLFVGIFSIVFFLTGFFWSKYFFRFVFVKGLRKAGYVGFVKYVNDVKALEMSIYESKRTLKLV